MKKIYYIIFGMSILLSSCREEEVELCTDPAQRIYLRATVENGITISRAPFNPPTNPTDELTAPNESNPLKAAVWASTTANEFKNTGKNGSQGDGYVVALHTKANFTNSKEQLLIDAVYPKPKENTDLVGTVVYFVGMNPEPGWTVDATGKKAEKTFNGSEDVMFAPQIDGSYGENVDTETWPTFHFNHLLTWLRVKIKAESEIVSEAWGKLKSLKVKSSNGNTVTIDLSKTYSPAYNPGATENCVSFSAGDGVTLDFYKTGTDNVFLKEDDESTWQKLPYDDFKEVAYVLCAPVIASKENIDGLTTEYTLVVKTERRTVEVPIDLKEDDTTCFEGSTMNRQFTLNLNFKMGNNILVTASVTDWKAGGIINGTVTPNTTAKTD